MRLRTAITVLILFGATVESALGGSREKHEVKIEYALEPTGELPEGLTTVAILDAGVETDGSEDDDRSKKWATIAADLIENMIQDSATRFGSSLVVAKRRETAKVMAEKDLQAAGLADASAAFQAGKLLGVQALVTCKINIRTEVKKGSKRTMDLGGIFGVGRGGWRHGHNSVRRRDAVQISRHVTVQCSFALVDAVTGEALLQVSPDPARKLDKASPSPLFGSSKGEEDLDPVDGIIGALVERDAREFVGTFLPIRVAYTYPLESSRRKPSRKGVRMLRADEPDTAMKWFKAAIKKDPEDHRSAFCLGITHELLGDVDNALSWYRKAVAAPDVDDEELELYMAAKKRLARDKDRIRKPDAKRLAGNEATPESPVN